MIGKERNQSLDEENHKYKKADGMNFLIVSEVSSCVGNPAYRIDNFYIIYF